MDDGVDKLLPFLIELWFHLTVGIEVLSQHDWLFWELTKVSITYISFIMSVFIHIILFNLPFVYIKRLSHYVELRQKARQNRGSFMNTNRSHTRRDGNSTSDKLANATSRTASNSKKSGHRRSSQGSLHRAHSHHNVKASITRQGSFSSSSNSAPRKSAIIINTKPNTTALRRSPSSGNILKKSSTLSNFNSRAPSFKRQPSTSALLKKPSFKRVQSSHMKSRHHSKSNGTNNTALSRSSSHSSIIRPSSDSASKKTHKSRDFKLTSMVHAEGYNEDMSFKSKLDEINGMSRQESFTSGLSSGGGRSDRDTSSFHESVPSESTRQNSFKPVKSIPSLKIHSKVPPLDVAPPELRASRTGSKSNLPSPDRSLAVSCSDVDLATTDQHPGQAAGVLGELDSLAYSESQGSPGKFVKQPPRIAAPLPPLNMLTLSKPSSSMRMSTGDLMSPLTDKNDVMDRSFNSQAIDTASQTIGSNPKPVVQSLAIDDKAASSTYAIGTSIYGLFTTSTGTQRWYPGKIAAVNADGTYDVLYNDGDSEKGKPSNILRRSRTSSDGASARPSNKAAAEASVTTQAAIVPQVASVSAVQSVYQVNDSVDGLFTVTNGTQRWYPGKITAVNADGTYDITYNDGDREKSKHISAVRRSKTVVADTSPRSAHKSVHTSDTQGTVKNSVYARASAKQLVSPTTDAHKAKHAGTPSLSFPLQPVTATFSSPYDHSQSFKMPLFHAGESIDGLTLLPNGTQRWLPATIEAVNQDGTYNIKYKDGDSDKGKAERDIRRARLRGSLPNVLVPSLGDSVTRKGTRADHMPLDKSMKRSVKHMGNILVVNDEIFALYTLPSQKKRWFPGKILDVYDDETYKIRYHDGEEEDHKPLADIRRSHTIKFDVPDVPPVTTYGSRLRSIKLSNTRSRKVTKAVHDAASSYAKSSKELIGQRTYALSEEVDALFTLPNGKARWFCANISAVHLDGTYKVTYNDGDVDDYKAASEIRRTKIGPTRVIDGSSCTSSRSNALNSSGATQLEASRSSDFALREATEYNRDSYMLISRESLPTINQSPRDSQYTDFNRDSLMSFNRDSFYERSSSPVKFTRGSVPEEAALVEQAGSDVYTVGDSVDGLFTVTNGTQRWYPGKITAVNADGTYDVLYNDGDSEKGKYVSSLRLSKKEGENRVETTTHVNGFMLTTDVTATATTSISVALFKPGERVDGLFHVGNGNQRWYPGVIDDINPDGTYRFRHANDSINVVNKSEFEIRKNKVIDSTGENPQDQSSNVDSTPEDKSIITSGRSQFSSTSPRSQDWVSPRSKLEEGEEEEDSDEDDDDGGDQFVSIHAYHPLIFNALSLYLSFFFPRFSRSLRSSANTAQTEYTMVCTLAYKPHLCYVLITC